MTKSWGFSHWERMVHSSTLMGYSLHLAFFTMIFVMLLGRLPWQQLSEQGVPQLHHLSVFYGNVLPVILFIMVINWAGAPPEIERLTLKIGAVLGPATLGMVYLLYQSSIDVKYWGLDILFISGYIFVYIALVIIFSKRSKRMLKKQGNGGEKGASLEGTSEEPRAKAVSYNGRFSAVAAMLPVLASTTVTLVYPFAVMPAFFGGSTATRLVICLVLHPLLLEAAEALGRSVKAERAALKLMQGGISYERAKRSIMNGSVSQFGMKQLMAFHRRFMSVTATCEACSVPIFPLRFYLPALPTQTRLLNMGTPTATIVAVVVASIEESLERGFLVQIDGALRRWRGKPSLEGDELRLQRLVWMCDANQSAIAELNAIIVSSTAQILLERHSIVLALGYSPGVRLDIAVVFVQLLLELLLEISVDNMSMWAESEHGIPISEYFASIANKKTFAYHAAMSIVTCTNVLYSFIRHPQMFACDSNIVCDCTDRPQFKGWYNEACSVNATMEARQARTTNSTDGRYEMFENVDVLAIVVAVVTTFSMLTVIASSVLFARHRKRQQAIVALQADVAAERQAKRLAERRNTELKKILERAQKEVDEAVGENAHLLRPYLINFEELRLEDEIGNGSFGVVWKGTFRGEVVAIKTVRVTKVGSKVMAPLKHPSLVNMIGGCWEDGPDKLAIVLEFCGRKTLKHLLNDANDRGLGDPIIHRDLKSENIMICDDYTPRVGDLGEATRFDEKLALANGDDSEFALLTMTMVGTPMYVAPEILRSQQYNKAVDVFSFAIVLLEIGCRSHSFVVKQCIRASQSHSSTSPCVLGWRPKPNKEFVVQKPGLWALVQDCWKADPNDRPTFCEVLPRIDALRPSIEATSEISVDWRSSTFSSAEAVQTVNSRANISPSRFSSGVALGRSILGRMSSGIIGGKNPSRGRILSENSIAIPHKHRTDPLEKHIGALRSTEHGISLNISFEYDPDQERSVLGKGKFGTVFAVTSTLDGQQYAMKRLPVLMNETDSIDSDAMTDLTQEVLKLSNVRSEYFVRYVTSSITQQYLFVVMERLHGVEFRDLVVARKSLNIGFHEHQIKRWLEQLAAGLAYLDEIKLVHQDLHNGNVMITWDPSEEAAQAKLAAANDDLLSTATRVKILDLGLAAFKSEHVTRTKHMTRTLRTMRGASFTDRRNPFVEMAASDVSGFKGIRAPELWAAQPCDLVRFDNKIDVWALGLLMCEAVLCNPIEEWYEERATLLAFGRDRGLQEAKIAEATSTMPLIGGLISQMLTEEPRFRIAAREVSQVTMNQSLGGFPVEEERFFCRMFSARKWLAALGFHSNEDFVAWRRLQTQDLLLLFNDRSKYEWNVLKHISIPDTVHCDWCTTQGTSSRLYRVRIPLECTDALLAWTACKNSVGTRKFFTGGDRSVVDNRVLSMLDETISEEERCLVSWQLLRMPRPMPKRYSSMVSYASKADLILANYQLPLSCEDLIEGSVGSQLLHGSLPGDVKCYSFKFEVLTSGVVTLVCLFQANFSVGESAYHSILRRVSYVGVDRVGLSIVKGARGIARRADELAELLQRMNATAQQRTIRGEPEG